jgi:hypothetical protein
MHLLLESLNVFEQSSQSATQMFLESKKEEAGLNNITFFLLKSAQCS